MTIKIRDKILIITVTTLLLAIGMNTFVISRMFRKEYSAALQSKMDVIANTLRSQIERLLGLGLAIDNIEGFEAQCKEVLHKHKEVAYAMVSRISGKILFHNDTKQQGERIKEPEILEALEQNQQIACLSKIAGQTYYNTVVPVSDGSSEPHIAVIVGFPTALIDHKVKELRSYSYLMALVSLGFAVFLLLMSLSISVTKPLSGLVTTIQHIRNSSDLDRKVTVRTTDEIGKLAKSFNQMVEDLNKTTVSRDSLMKEVTDRKKAEEELIQLLSLHTATLEATADGILVVDINGHVVTSNHKFLQLWRIPESLATTRDDEKLLAYVLDQLAGPEEFLTEVKRLYAHPQEQSCDVLEFKDGRIFERFSHPQKVGERIVGRVWSFRDITERKKAEERLRKAEEKYRAQFEGALDAIFVADAETGILIDCNPSATKLVGRKKSELIGQHQRILHPPEKIVDGFSKSFKEHQNKQKGQMLETQIITKTGLIKDVAIKASMIDVAGKTVQQGIFRDITEQKKAEAALQESEERFKQVSENAGEWIWEVNTEGLYTYSNPIVEQVLGYKPEEIVGKKHFYDFFAPDVKEELKKAALEAFAGGVNFKGFINPNVHKNGNIVILETNGTPVIDDKGNFCGYRGADRDITERKKAQEELQRTHEKLLEASRTAGMAEVATDVLHNVGNVLNSINVSADFITDKVLNSKAKKLKKVTDMIAEHADNLGAFLTEDLQGRYIPLYLTQATGLIIDEQADIAEKLKSLTKNVEHIRQIIHAQQRYAKTGGLEVLTSINEIVKHAIEINNIDLQQKDTNCTLELEELPEVRLDKQRVLQILVNLVSNAKYALGKSEKQKKSLTIRCYKHSEDRLVIEVEDNGVGISKKNMSRIFRHGFTTKEGGHGFGLHSSAIAAREIGGALTARSDGVGKGAKFILELPFKPLEQT